MEKREIIEHLRAAKAAHIKWVQKAKLLINGLDVEEGTIPVDATECKFGKWFYSEGQVLNSLTHISPTAIESLEVLHSQLHDEYLKIFNIFFNKAKAGLICKLFGLKRRNVSDEEYRVSREYFNSLEIISKDLLEEINKLEKELIIVSEEEIQSLV